jgi:alanyl-tRNA synthetase
MGEMSSELCGGTHLDRTGQIGLFRITSEGSIAAGVRRIEAVVGEVAYMTQRESESVLRELTGLLKIGRDDLVERVERLLDEERDLRRQIAGMESKLASSRVGDIVNSAEELDGVRIVAQSFSGVAVDSLRQMLDDIKNRMGSVVAVLGSEMDGKVVFVAGVTSDLIDKGLKAGDIVREVAKITGGGGGGRPEMAQAGGRDAAKLEEAVNAVRQIVQGFMEQASGVSKDA